jgi:excisionase family DNA binding protein
VRGDIREWILNLETPWFTTSEAAAYLKINRRTLLEWVRQGKVKGYRLSGVIRHVWRFRKSDLDAMLCPSSADSADREAA